MADIKDDLDGLRAEIKPIGQRVKALMRHDFFDQKPEERHPRDAKADVSEMKANVMLAYRHLEDARMKLGKSLQALAGGESIYDQKPPTA